MTTRREIVTKCGAGLAAIIAAGKAPAAIVKSMLAARNAFAAGGGGLSAKSYVQDGLIAMWDGIENAGWGVHDETNAIWKDLIGGYDLTLGINVAWADTHNGIYCASTNGGAFRSGRISPYDVEIVLKRPALTTYGIFFQDTSELDFGNPQGSQILAWKNNDVGQGANGYYFAPINVPIQIHYQKYPYIYAPTSACKINGVEVSRTSTSEAWSVPGTAISLGGRSDGTSTYKNANNMVGYVYACRCYDRNLTAAEVAANYAVDKARFNLPTT